MEYDTADVVDAVKTACDPPGEQGGGLMLYQITRDGSTGTANPMGRTIDMFERIN